MWKIEFIALKGLEEQLVEVVMAEHILIAARVASEPAVVVVC
jgi:hypothetical protein